MIPLRVTCAIGIAIICTANAAPAQVQSDQTATDQKAEAQFNFQRGLAPLVVRGLGLYVASRIANGEEAVNQDAKMFKPDNFLRKFGSTAIKILKMAENQEADAQFWEVASPILLKGLDSYAMKKFINDGEMAQNQDTKAVNFLSAVGPMLLHGLGSYLANRIANGEMAGNQEAKAQIWEKLGPILIHGAGNYLANRVTNGGTVQNEEADAQFWGTVLKFVAPYVIDKIIGGEIAMSEVAKALPEEAKAEFWPLVIGSRASG